MCIKHNVYVNKSSLTPCSTVVALGKETIGEVGGMAVRGRRCGEGDEGRGMKEGGMKVEGLELKTNAISAAAEKKQHLLLCEICFSVLCSPQI